jgi:hypothetical protein
MRFEVPQFIEIEDKIFGPLTWRQFLYLGGGIGAAIAIFFIMPWWVFILIGLPLSALAGALSFYPVNNRPFSFFLEAIFNYLGGTKQYLWRQERQIIYKESFAPNSTRLPPLTASPTMSKEKRGVAALARRLELQAIQKQQS